MAVSDSRAVIALHQIGQLDVMRQLFSAVAVPPAVLAETAPSLPDHPSWIVRRVLERPIDPRIRQVALDPGESEAIALAIEISAPWIVLDELPARRFAEAIGLPVLGAVGMLVRAKRRGMLPAVRPSLDALVAVGFFISTSLYRRVLADAGEGYDAQ